MKLEHLEKVLMVLEDSRVVLAYDGELPTECSFCGGEMVGHESCEYDEAIRLVKLNIMVLEDEENKEYPEGIGND